MRLKELIKNLDYKRLENFSDSEIKGISCNSQNIRSGYLFVAIKGQSDDGHNFIDQAIHRGAAAVILQKNLPLKKKVPKILVPESKTAYSCVCASFFGYPAKKLTNIGVTGTCGKTTVSYLIEKILGCAGQSCGVIGTVNYRVGPRQHSAINTTPQADILQSFLQEIVLAQSKYAIIEVSSHALNQRRVEGIDFSTAIFTNLSPEHLDYHRTIKNYFSSKAHLFENLAKDAYAIINTDDIWGRRLVKRIHCHLLTYGIQRPAQIQAKNLKLNIEGGKFSVVTPRGKLKIETPLLGRHNVYNILAAVACAFVENIDFSHIASGIQAFTGVPGRLERIDCGQEFLVFIDYAHTDDALAKVLLTLRQMGGKKIISVFGCGGDRDKAKRPRMGRIATQLSDFAIITSDNPRSEDPKRIAADILKGINKRRNNYKVVLDRFRAIEDAVSLAGDGDIVLIAGKGHESSQIFAHKSIHFNDRETVEKILQTPNSELRTLN